jgi:hypothetical protein
VPKAAAAIIRVTGSQLGSKKRLRFLKPFLALPKPIQLHPTSFDIIPSIIASPNHTSRFRRHSLSIRRISILFRNFCFFQPLEIELQSYYEQFLFYPVRFRFFQPLEQDKRARAADRAKPPATIPPTKNVELNWERFISSNDNSADPAETPATILITRTRQARATIPIYIKESIIEH